MKNYTTLLWDLDNTILNFDKGMDLALRQTFEYMGIPYDPVKAEIYERINLSYWKRMERGEIKRDDIFVGRYRDFFAEIGYDLKTPEDVNRYYLDKVAGYAFLIPGAFDTLRELSLTKDMYLITNGTKDAQVRRIALCGIGPFFKGFFISEDVGFDKPSAEYFNAILPQIAEPYKDNMLIIGDSLTSDIKGGVINGIDTLWYNPSNSVNNTEIKPLMTVHNYNELRDVFDLNPLKN